MNGTKSTTSKSWTSKKNKKAYHQTIKLAGCILITNCLIYLFATAGNEQNTPNPPKKINEQHNFIQLPLKTFIPSLEFPQKVSIYTPSKKKIIALAYLHKRMDAVQQDQLPLYQIELTDQDLTKIIKYKSDYFIAYPINHHHEKNYEIIF